MPQVAPVFCLLTLGLLGSNAAFPEISFRDMVVLYACPCRAQSHQPLFSELIIAVGSRRFLSVSPAKESLKTPLYLEICCYGSGWAGSETAALGD